MSKIRETIRRYARRDNWFGFSCSVLVWFFRKGPSAAGRLIATRRWFRREHKYSLKNACSLMAVPEEELRRQREVSAVSALLFSVVTPLYNTPVTFLQEMIESVLAQTYPCWELCLADGSDGDHPEVGALCREYAARDPRVRYTRLSRNGGISENSNACLAMASGEYIALLDHDDLLRPNALFENAKAIRETGADFLYSDEYVFISPDIENIYATHFKPDFSPENLLTNNYICHLSVFKRSLLDSTGGFRPAYDGSQDHDLILRLTDRASRVEHVPGPLYLWRSHSASVASDISAKTYAIEAGRTAVRDFLSSKGIGAQVESVDAYPTMYHVRWPVGGDPSVCVVLDLVSSPRSPAEILRQVENLRTSSGCASVTFAVIVGKPVAAADAPGFRWFVSPETSRPKRLNQVVRQVSADYLLLLDPSLSPLSDGWLREMLMLSQQSPIGAVGARLLFRNRTVRHGGLTLGLGKDRLVGRRFYRYPEEESGYFGQLAVVQDLSAVSGECLLVSREKYEQAGGFSESYRSGLFDVDLCLKLRQLQYRNLYCPFSIFIGGWRRRFPLEYGREWPDYQEDSAVFRSAWADILSAPDPYYNPYLSLDHADYHPVPPEVR